MKTYDTECLQLARTFINYSNDKPDQWQQLADKLAKEIQQTIEDFMKDNNLQ